MSHPGLDSREEHRILPMRRKVSYGIGGIGDAVLANGILAAGTLYTLALKMNMTTIGAVMVLPRVWDAVTDPLMGNISDNTRTRWGRRRPYILLGGVATGVLFFLTMSPPAALEERGILKYFFVLSMLYFTAYTVFAVAYGGLGLELSSDYHERTRVMGYRAFTAIGGMVAGTAMWITFHPVWPSEQRGMQVMGLVFGAIAVAAAIVVAFGTKEGAEVQSQRRIQLFQALRHTMSNRQFLILCGALCLFVLGLYVTIPLYPILNSYYVYDGDLEAASKLEFARGTVYALLMLGTIFPITWAGTKLGKQRAFALCMFLGIVGTGSVWFLFTPSLPYLQLLVAVVLAFSLPAVQVFPMAIMADICDLDELKTGLRREGMYGASFGFLIKLVLSVTVFCAGIALDVAGIDQKLNTQPPEALFRLRLIATFLPMTLIFLSGMLLLALDVPEAKIREVRAILEKRHNEKE